MYLVALYGQVDAFEMTSTSIGEAYIDACRANCALLGKEIFLVRKLSPTSGPRTSVRRRLSSDIDYAFLTVGHFFESVSRTVYQFEKEEDVLMIPRYELLVEHALELIEKFVPVLRGEFLKSRLELCSLHPRIAGYIDEYMDRDSPRKY